MNLKEDIKSITYLKTRSAEVINSVNRNRRPMVITQNGEARAVVQDIESYEATRKALLLIKLMAQAEKDIQNGRVIKHADFMNRIEKRIRGQRKSV
jgi:prevent-host-death family protein